jgi:hypothetical protein
MKVWCSLPPRKKWSLTLLVLKYYSSNEVIQQHPRDLTNDLSYDHKPILFLDIMKVIKGKDFYIFVSREQSAKFSSDGPIKEAPYKRKKNLSCTQYIVRTILGFHIQKNYQS